MTEIIEDIKQEGITSAYIEAPFDGAQEALESENYFIISLKRNAKLRIQQGKNSGISKNGNWTREGILWVPKGKPKLVPTSPILYSPKEAIQDHRYEREFYPTRERIESALVDSVDFPEKNIEIPTNRFSEDALTVFAFGGEVEARNYGEFLREAGIKEMLVRAVAQSYVDSQNQPFARQMWFGNLDCRSALDGDNRYLNVSYRLRGIKEDDVGY